MTDIQTRDARAIGEVLELGAGIGDGESHWIVCFRSPWEDVEEKNFCLWEPLLKNFDDCANAGGGLSGI